MSKHDRILKHLASVCNQLLPFFSQCYSFLVLSLSRFLSSFFLLSFTFALFLSFWNSPSLTFVIPLDFSYNIFFLSARMHAYALTYTFYRCPGFCLPISALKNFHSLLLLSNFFKPHNFREFYSSCALILFSFLTRTRSFVFGERFLCLQNDALYDNSKCDFFNRSWRAMSYMY